MYDVPSGSTGTWTPAITAAAGASGTEKLCASVAGGTNAVLTEPGGTSPCNGATISSNATNVELKIPVSGQANASGITDTVSCYLMLEPQSDIIGDGTVGGGLWILNEASGSLRAGFCFEPNPIAVPYGHVRGLDVNNSAATNAKAVFDVAKSDDVSVIEQVRVNSEVNSDEEGYSRLQNMRHWR
jgi:hypothetical protein